VVVVGARPVGVGVGGRGWGLGLGLGVGDLLCKAYIVYYSIDETNQGPNPPDATPHSTPQHPITHPITPHHTLEPPTHLNSEVGMSKVTTPSGLG